MTNPDKYMGLLLGTAVGDAVALPFEGMSAARARKRCKNVDRYRMLGRTGFVSDDTEQSVLLLESILGSGGDDEKAVKRFRRALVGWFWRLPWGIGLSTLRACLLLTFGVKNSGIKSAGNGSAMRAGVLALAFPEDDERRRAMATAQSRTTHVDSRAIDGAIFVAELAALCLKSGTDADRRALVETAASVIEDEDVVKAVKVGLMAAGDDTQHQALKATGFVLHTLSTAVSAFVRSSSAEEAFLGVIHKGGDTDTVGAIVGSWVGALYGESGLPQNLTENLQRGPYGRDHLRGLVQAALGKGPVPKWSRTVALLRNLCMYPVVLAHGFRRLFPG